MTKRDDLIAQFLFDRFNHSDFRWDEILEYEKDGWRTDAKEALRLASQQEVNATVEQLAKDLQEALKPCPFCGGNNIRIFASSDWYYTRCIICEGQIGGLERTVDAATRRWNARALPASAPKAARWDDDKAAEATLSHPDTRGSVQVKPPLRKFAQWIEREKDGKTITLWMRTTAGTHFRHSVCIDSGYGDVFVELEATLPNLSAGGHDSDCAIHNEPAYPNGPCDCSLSLPRLRDR